MKNFKTICLILIIISLFAFNIQPADASFFNWFKSFFSKPTPQELPASISKPLMDVQEETLVEPSQKVQLEGFEAPKEVIKEIPIEKVITETITETIEKIIEVPIDYPECSACPICSDCPNNSSLINSLKYKIESLESQVNSLKTENQDLRNALQDLPENVSSQSSPIITISKVPYAGDSQVMFSISNTGDAPARINKLVVEIIKLESNPANVISKINLSFVGPVTHSPVSVSTPFEQFIEFYPKTNEIPAGESVTYRMHFSVLGGVINNYKYQFRVKYSENNIVNLLTSENIQFNDLLLPEKQMVY